MRVPHPHKIAFTERVFIYQNPALCITRFFIEFLKFAEGGGGFLKKKLCTLSDIFILKKQGTFRYVATYKEPEANAYRAYVARNIPQILPCSTPRKIAVLTIKIIFLTIKIIDNAQKPACLIFLTIKIIDNAQKPSCLILLTIRIIDNAPKPVCLWSTNHCWTVTQMAILIHPNFFWPERRNMWTSMATSMIHLMI